MGARGLADDDGRDGGFADARVEAGVREAFLEVAGVGPELCDALRLGFQNLESRYAGCGHGGRMRRGEEERARAVIEEFDQVFRSADVAAEGADGLGKR